jgi:bla regulator protein BlaR1
VKPLLVLLRLLLPVTPSTGWNPFRLDRHTKSVPVATSLTPTLTPVATTFSGSSLQPPVVSHASQHRSVSQWMALVWLCGGVGFVLLTLVRHWKFARWAGRLAVASDPVLIELVEQCRTELSIKRRVRIVVIPGRNSAAVCGVFRPCLLLPEGMLGILNRREARLVLLHELFHIRRNDVPIGWIRAFALALHWFNPLVWIAMRQYAWIRS